MNYFRTPVLLAILCLLISYQTRGQVQKTTLNLGESITTEIGGNQKHQYNINLADDQFAFIKLMQIGVDVMITTYDTEGKKIQEFDSPNGKNGPELITINSTKNGSYTLEVGLFEEVKVPGKYELVVESIRPKAISPNEKLEEFLLLNNWDSEQKPGAAIAVVKGDEIVYKKGYGIANLEYDIPITTRSIFSIASVSKQFTAFAILLLEKEGKLSLDDDIRKYIPEVPDFGHTITLRHLATHTSGLSLFLPFAGWDQSDVCTGTDILRMISKQTKLNFAPGEKYTYSNVGFTLLAEVVSRVSGQTFSKFTSANIFEPLGMSHSKFRDDYEEIIKNRTYSYYLKNGNYKKSNLSSSLVGSSGLFTTVEDLSRWAMNFSSPKVGDANIIKKMNTLATLNNGETFEGALGQFVKKYNDCLKMIHHGGAHAGYRSVLVRFPDQDFSVAVIGNSADFDPYYIAHKIVDIYLEADIEKEKSKEILVQKKEITLDPKILESFVGRYEFDKGGLFNISKENGQLTCQSTGHSKFSLEPNTNMNFSITGTPASIDFFKNKNGKIESLKLNHESGSIMPATKLKPGEKPFDPATVNLSEFTGSFYCKELSTEYVFSVKGERLVRQHYRMNDLKLRPIKKDIFSGFGGQFKFIRDANNNISGFTFSDTRTYNITFKKQTR